MEINKIRPSDLEIEAKEAYEKDLQFYKHR
jgi:hypothetical protein